MAAFPHFSRVGRLVRYLLCVGGLGVVTLQAATVSVTDNVSTFSTFEAINGGILKDATYDQQTGQGADDFVGDATNGYYGFYYKFGQIGGVDSLVFRFRLNLLGISQGSPKFTGNIRLGVDGDGDGNVDLFFGVSTTQGQTPEIVFQNPTGTALDANTSPNTSALGTVYGSIATTTSNYYYSEVTDGSSYHTNKVNVPNTDAFLTFALPFSTFKTYLEAQLTAKTITLQTYLRFVAFSSTQGNAVNQDVYGSTGIGTVRYDQGGGFTNFYNANGNVIPEASTVVQMIAFGLSGLGVVVWRRKRLTRGGAA
jgi:hypothetical protein